MKEESSVSGILSLECGLEIEALFLSWSKSFYVNNFRKSYLLDHIKVNHDFYLHVLFILKSIALNFCDGQVFEKLSISFVGIWLT